MKRRMAFLMSVAITANMFSMTSVYASEEFTDIEASARLAEAEMSETWSDGTDILEEVFSDPVESAGETNGINVSENLKIPPDVSGSYVDEGLGDKYLTITADENYINKISGIVVNDTGWKQSWSKFSLSASQYYLLKNESKIFFKHGSGDGILKTGDSITIKSTGYQDLELEVTADGENFTVQKKVAGNNQQTPPVFTGRKIEQLGSDYFAIVTEEENVAYLQSISAIQVDETDWEKATIAAATFGRKAYCLDTENHRILFDSSKLFVGNVITIKSTGYSDLFLKVTGIGADFAVEVTDSGSSNINGPSNGQETLHVRLSGYFESAVTGQTKYDAISGASGSATVNKNSNVTVEAAILPDGQTPTDTDWKPLSEQSSVTVNKSKTTVNIETAKCGMTGTYSTYDSSLTLSGTPTTPGTYPVSVTITDESGRTATSNSLDFKVYGTTESLSDHLKLENATQTSDGKYMYDMEPWVMPYFNHENTEENVVASVTVPTDIKAWYGSHTSGTYGELGYAVEDSVPVQTLVIPSGCNLTMVNMKILSSVKIVVENGGKLNIRDSSVHGQIEVMSGGSVCVNYDEYSGQFLTGSSINGQLILNNGAVLENSMIYSNTNFLANGTWVRHNTSPVVVTNGNVTIKGEVYIKGDEAATGTDPETNKSYSGQPALKVNSGTVTIEKEGILALYGGGIKATTSVGGHALLLNDGKIAGDGTLIAVGGRGDGDDGGNGVSGNGTISVNSAYLEGGVTYFPKKGSVPGDAFTSGVDVSDSKNLGLVYGEEITTNAESAPDTYWSDITQKPDLSNCLKEIKPVTSSKPTLPSNPTPTPTPPSDPTPTPPSDPTPTPPSDPTPTPVPDIYPDGTVADEDGNFTTPNGTIVKTDGTIILPNGNVLNPDSQGNKPTLDKEGNVTDVSGNVYYSDGSITDSQGNYKKPSTGVIETVYGKGNAVKVKLSAECKGAQGYDFVIGTSVDMLQTKQYQKVIKNQSSTEVTFSYMDAGTWYVACHAWTRDENGKKVFGQWSEVKEIQVTATTPKRPRIESVSVEGTTVTVTYTTSENAQGYDIVLGTKYAKVNNEKRPIEYGKYVKKIKGDKVTAVFKNVEPGTYYAGFHAWNRTSQDNSKVFSKWSNIKTVKVN